MDIANSLAPRSDQINADDLVAGPMTVTIREVVEGKATQPYDFLLVETDRAWRPPKTVRRLIAAAWGTTDGKVYEGRRVRLYRDARVAFGKDACGGVRVSHMSHLSEPFEVKLQVSKGKRELFHVDPLPELSRADQLRAEWKSANPERRAEIEAEVARLSAGDAPSGGEGS